MPTCSCLLLFVWGIRQSLSPPAPTARHPPRPGPASAQAVTGALEARRLQATGLELGRAAACAEGEADGHGPAPPGRLRGGRERQGGGKGQGGGEDGLLATPLLGPGCGAEGGADEEAGRGSSAGGEAGGAEGERGAAAVTAPEVSWAWLLGAGSLAGSLSGIMVCAGVGGAGGWVVVGLQAGGVEVAHSTSSSERAPPHALPSLSPLRLASVGVCRLNSGCLPYVYITYVHYIYIYYVYYITNVYITYVYRSCHNYSDLKFSDGPF
jgi:hypothetical protein